MSKAIVVLAALTAACCTPLLAQNNHPTPPVETRAVALDSPIRLDGRLDEPVWQTAPAASDFRQNQPHEGQAATQRTEVRFAYDAAAIYVGARMFDTEGAAGVRTRLVRRDADPNSDYLEVIFDTYHDHIGRLFFQVNPSGARFDANGLGGGGDDSWDPVWEVKTTIDSLGWTAEMRIPFSQLRYPNTAEEQTWGLQIWRQENRLNELSQWSFWGLTEPGGPPRFGHLHGLVIQRAPGRAEILPYTVGRSANVPGDTADPFYDPHAIDGRIGADARVLLTSNLTLNATVNPDFGQVEVDPAVVNLSAFETSLQERRPFFVEGAGYFGLGGLSCFFCSNVSSLSMLSTRRVGRAPQVAGHAFVEAGPSGFVDLPENAAILGAAKLTGRTPSGWSIGALDAVTNRERATVQRSDSSRARIEVEPLTNYFAGRVAKDLRGGATVIRAMGTSVVRDLSDAFVADRLARHSEALGLATEMWFSKRTYRLMAQLAGTQVSGDSTAMLAFQRSSARYFQRPDRKNGSNGLLSDAYDSSLTVLRGLGGYTRFSRESGNWLWEASVNFRTPGFDNNDITFFSRADYVWMGGNVFRQWTKPTSWYRQVFVIAGGQQQYNFDHDLTDRQIQLFGYIQPLNYWEMSGFWIHRASVFDDRLTRGGPAQRRAGLDFWSTSVSTDRRKKLVVNWNGEMGCDGDGRCSRSASVEFQVRPKSNVSLTLGPSLGHDETATQYVRTVYQPSDTNYVFADLVQNSIGMNTRFNVTFSPNLTLELFLQPLIVSGQFSRYKEYAVPRGLQRLLYGTDIGTIDTTPPPPGSGQPATLVVDPDGGGPDTTFSFGDPSFTFRSLRGNAVLRWEYRPGSTLFLVWTREGDSSLTRGAIDFGDDFGALFQGPSRNIFLIKVNYWLGF